MSSNSMVIETSRLILRPFGPSDASGIADMGVERVKAAFLPDWVKTPPEAEELARFLGARMQSPDPRTGPVVWAVTLRETGELIGHAGVGAKAELGEVELGYAVSQRHAGRGLATEAAKAAVWWAFEHGGLSYISALALPENAASARVLDKLGFVPAGSRRLGHGAGERDFLYFRLYRLDALPSPEWEPPAAGEPMGAFFDLRAGGYEAHMRQDPDFDRFYAGAVAPIPETDAALRILDLGCGTGLELGPLFRRAPNARVTCLDLSDEMLRILRDTHRDRLEQLTIIQASYVDWAYPDAAFDYALSVNTMHHFLEPRKTAIYRIIRQALKPGGAYVEADFIVDAPMMEQYLRRYRRIMAAAGGGTPDGTLHVDIPFTVDVQKRLLLEAGFSSVRSHMERIQPEHSGAVLVAER